MADECRAGTLAGAGDVADESEDEGNHEDCNEVISCLRCLFHNLIGVDGLSTWIYG